MSSVWPENEQARLEALRSYQILDTLPEASFDRLTRLASAICGVPIALVSLIDTDRQWFKSRVGLDAAETARNISFCQHAILGTGIMEVEDATRDDRFRANPLVTEDPEIRFYAGAPLIDPDGFALGTLCVIDRQPRSLTQEQRTALRDLADEVMEHIRVRKERNTHSEARARLSSMIAALPDILFIFDNTGKFLDCHTGEGTRLWMQPKDFIGRRVTEIMPAEFAETVMARIRETQAKRGLVTFRYETPGAFHGENEYFEARMVLTEQDHILCVIRDVTTETRKTRKLAHAQQLLTLTGRVARLGAWEYWPQHDRLHLSDVFCELLEISPNEQVKMAEAMPRFVAKPNVEAVQSAISSCITEGKPFDLELPIVNAKGRNFWVRIQGAANFANGVCTSIHGTLQDIDSMKQVEVALDSARKQAEAANQAKSDFLSNMSHELRTPLNSILGFSQLLEMNTNRHLDSEELENVGHIRKAGSHLLNLISEILDLSRIESGNMDLVFEYFRMGEILEEAVVFVKPMAQRRDVGIEIIPQHEYTVHADRIRLKQVLLNLLTNAIKYNRTGGFVRIDYASAGTGYLRVSVRDSGPGIAAAQIPLLFQPFQRLGAETSTIEGTGIGLTITRRLMDLMHGDVFLRETSTDGSEFCIDVPLAAGPMTPIQRAIQVAGTAKNYISGTVLCVEDNADSLSLMEHFFRRMEHITLLTAKSGDQALELAHRTPVDLVLLDIHLPANSGYQVLRRLKSQPLTASVPVVAVSAAATRDDIERGRSAGFDEYLTKPVRLDRLEEIVIKYCHRHRSPRA